MMPCFFMARIMLTLNVHKASTFAPAAGCPYPHTICGLLSAAGVFLPLTVPSSTSPP
jgi:hypothetical protein